MSLSTEQMIELMAYADGELSGTERARVDALMATDIEAAQFVAQISPLGALVRESYEGDARTVQAIDSFDIADAVVAAAAGGASEPVRVASEPARVSSLDAARAKRAERLKTGGAVLAALAFAAAVFVVARQKEAAEVPMAKAPPSVPALSSPEAARSGVEVGAVESPGKSVSVFYLPGGNDVSTSVVIWVEETETK